MMLDGSPSAGHVHQLHGGSSHDRRKVNLRMPAPAEGASTDYYKREKRPVNLVATGPVGGGYQKWVFDQVA